MITAGQQIAGQANANKNKDVFGSILYNVKAYGAKGDGVTDDTAAIQKALNEGSGGTVYLPKGAYVVSGTLTFTGSGTRLIGEGTYSLLSLPSIPNGSVIISKVSVGPTIKSQDGLQHITIKNITVTRTLAAVSGNDAILFDGTSNLCTIENVEVSNHWYGLHLGSTGYSTVVGLYSHDNYADGVFVLNSTVSGALQWTFNHCLSQQNNGWGYKFQSQANSFGFVTMGSMVDMNTYGNTAGGIGFFGLPGTPINGVRMSNCFFGQDGGDELYMNVYGSGSHKFDGIYCEAAGTSMTGRGGATAATHAGHGINILNAQSVIINAATIIQNSYNGINSYATFLVVTGSDLRINGDNATAGANVGINIAGGSCTLTGNSSQGQKYGVFLTNDLGQLVGNRLQGNTVAPLAASVTLTNTIDVGNIKI